MSPPSTITIWHNPRCGKSRQTLELLREKGVEPAIREYLKQPPGKAEVEKLLDLVGHQPDPRRRGRVQGAQEEEG
jgi:arsenate reductase